MKRVYRIPVVAGLVEKDGKVLLGQRKQGSRHPLKWEFPGGKVEQGESPRSALARELMEELAIQANIGRELTRYEFTYPKGATLLLIFFEVRSFRGEIRNEVFERIAWEERANLPTYDFLDGDHDFVNRLARGEF
jgi:8-oxo-dGTP diphosphatase